MEQNPQLSGTAERGFHLQNAALSVSMKTKGFTDYRTVDHPLRVCFTQRTWVIQVRPQQENFPMIGHRHHPVQEEAGIGIDPWRGNDNLGSDQHGGILLPHACVLRCHDRHASTSSVLDLTLQVEVGLIGIHHPFPLKLLQWEPTGKLSGLALLAQWNPTLTHQHPSPIGSLAGQRRRCSTGALLPPPLDGRRRRITFSSASHSAPPGLPSFAASCRPNQDSPIPSTPAGRDGQVAGSPNPTPRLPTAPNPTSSSPAAPNPTRSSPAAGNPTDSFRCLLSIPCTMYDSDADVLLMDSSDNFQDSCLCFC